jgi:hypothetical protein
MDDLLRELKTCLVVDDSGIIRKVARRIQEATDFRIVEAKDGAAALSGDFPQTSFRFVSRGRA